MYLYKLQPPKKLQWARVQRILIDMEVKEILEMGLIYRFLVGAKEGWEVLPAINLKILNKINLSNTYFSVHT